MRSLRSLLQHKAVRTHLSQIWKFAIAGGIGSIVDLSSLTVFIEYFGLSPKVAFLPSSGLAVIFVFLINKFFTFHNRERAYANQVFKFAMVYGVAILLNLGMSYTFLWIGTSLFGTTVREVYLALAARVLAIGIGAFWNYTLSHGFIFKKKEPIETAVF